MDQFRKRTCNPKLGQTNAALPKLLLQCILIYEVEQSPVESIIRALRNHMGHPHLQKSHRSHKFFSSWLYTLCIGPMGANGESQIDDCDQSGFKTDKKNRSFKFSCWNVDEELTFMREHLLYSERFLLIKGVVKK